MITIASRGLFLSANAIKKVSIFVDTQKDR